MKITTTSTIALALTALIVAAPVSAATATVTQGSCYLTTEDKSVNLATLRRGLVVTILGQNAEGRYNVQVPAGSSKVSVEQGWKGSRLPENTGWISKLFVKADDAAPATPPSPAPSASPAAPEPPAGKSWKQKALDLLGIGSETPAEDKPAVATGGDTAPAGNPGPGTTAGTTQVKAKAPGKHKVRSLLEESRKGKTLILVNIPAQKVWVYKGGAQVMSIECRVGESNRSDLKAGENSKTRIGEHRLISWHEKYSNESYKPWTGELWQFAEGSAGAFGAYTAKFNDRVGQYIHGTYGSMGLDWAIAYFKWFGEGSHGCVRMSNANITSVHDLAPIGSQIVKVYALRQGTQEAPPTEDTWSNLYGYSDVKDNGYIDPDKGELIDYRDPKDAQRQ